jgi:hypothetical protein
LYREFCSYTGPNLVGLKASALALVAVLSGRFALFGTLFRSALFGALPALCHRLLYYFTLTALSNEKQLFGV